MDFSTINLDVLRTLPTYTLPSTQHLQTDPGNGCAGDPPGYPTYFTRAVYTAHGDTPNRGPSMVIRHEGALYVVERAEWAKGDTWEARRAHYEELMRRLWLSPFYGSARVRAWIEETYRHFAHCYRDDAGLVTDARDNGVVIFPVPSYKLRAFVDDPRFSTEWRMRERTAIDQYNAELLAHTMDVCTPENHVAYRRIAKFYPEHKPDRRLIDFPPERVGGMWWETEATQPTPENCRPRSMGKHPLNGTWCQWCGTHDIDQGLT